MSVRRLPPRAALAAILLAVLWGSAPAPAAAEEPKPQIGAPAALVMESSSGDVLWQRQGSKQRAIASTTKLMTALLVMERTERLSQLVRASGYVAAPIESKLGLRPGERLSVADLLRGLMLESANDAAVTLAEQVAGSRTAFVRLMNRRARQLGLTDTRYANPIGLDASGNHSSARDLATLAVELRRHEFIRRIANRTRVTLSTGDRPRKVANRNTLLVGNKWVNGLKTGHTSQAGYVLVGTYTRKGVSVVSVVLGTASPRARDADGLALLKWGWRQYVSVRPVVAGEVVARPEIRFRRGARLNLIAEGAVRRTVRRGAEITTRDVGVPASVTGPVPRGRRLGRREVRADGELIAAVPLVAEFTVPKAGPGQRTKDWFTKPLALLLAAGVLGGTLLVGRRVRRGPPRRRPARSSEPEAA